MPRTITRAAGALIAASALLLAGCSSTSAATAPETSAPSAQEPASEYFFESGELPENPVRVVALWRTGSALAELGTVSVGQLDGEYSEDEIDPANWADFEAIPSVGTFEGVDIEELIAADPDLVVGMDHGGLGIDYEEIAELFPVRILKIAEPTDVWRNYGVLADLVGKSTDFEARQAALDERLAALSEEYGDVVGDLAVTSLGSTEGSIWVDTSKALSYERLTAAGFGYNTDYTQNPERYVQELTLENLPTLSEQDIIFYDAELDGSVAADVQAVIDEPAFQELPAVQAGHVYQLRGATVYSFGAADLMLDDIEAAAAAYAADQQ